MSEMIKNSFEWCWYFILDMFNLLWCLLFIFIEGLLNIIVNYEIDINNKLIKLIGVVFLLDDLFGICEVYWFKNGKLIDI